MAKEDGLGSFISGIINSRVEGLKNAAIQGVEDMARNITTGAKTVDGVLRDTNTSYLEADADPSQPIYTVMTKGEGKNARVTLWPDRLEWERGRGVSGGKVVAGLLTVGLSLAVTGLRGSKDAFETLPLAAISAVSLRRGDGGQVVSLATAGGDIDFLVSRQNAAEFRLAILNQMQVLSSTPQKVVIEGAVSAPATIDFTEQLKKLGELRDSGILTEEEFQAKKAEILKKI